MGSYVRGMDAITAAQRDDPKTAGAFGLSVIGTVLCWVGICYTPSRIFFDNKAAGVSLPVFATVISTVVGLMVLHATGSRSRSHLKFVGGAPNMTAIVILMFSAYCLNVWTIEHRQDKGFATGILDDSNTAFNCYIAGAVFCLFAHFFYLWNIPTRVAELKAAEQHARSAQTSGQQPENMYGENFTKPASGY